MTMQRGCGMANGTAASKKRTAFEQQVARDRRRFKEKYFACTENPAVRRAIKKILVTEEKEMSVSSATKESAR